MAEMQKPQTNAGASGNIDIRVLAQIFKSQVGDFFHKITINDIIAVIFFVWFLFWLDRKEREDQTGKITKIINFVGAVYLIGYGLYIARPLIWILLNW